MEDVKDDTMRAMEQVLELLKDVTGAKTEQLTQELRTRVEAQRKKIRTVVEKQKTKARRVITGDSSKRIRDHLKEEPQVRFIDKLSFTFGTLTLIFTQYILLTAPKAFPLYYSFTIPTLVLVRYFLYKQLKYQYFLFDFCYFVQVLCLFYIHAIPSSRPLFQSVFVFANGPLLCAILAWRNSLVFHSLDKITSVFIHAFPPLLTWALRWHSGMEDDWATIDVHGAWTYPLGIYAVWQALYYLKTQHVDKAILQEDETIQTSVRWFARDYGNPMNIAALKVTRWLGVMDKQESWDPSHIKTQVVFMVSQLIYTLLTMAPIPLLYHYYYVHSAFLILVLIMCVWNGACYYIEVFSSRYTKKFKSHPR